MMPAPFRWAAGPLWGIFSVVSTILERIRTDLKAAMKAGDRTRLSTLRLLISELHNRRIEVGRDLSDDEAIEILGRAVKKRREAEEQYAKGGREDRAAAEAAEAEIIQEYLPERLDESALDALIDEAVATTSAASVKDMGRVMAHLMPRVKGRADGAEISRKVKERLS
jgi:hypothetical protein